MRGSDSHEAFKSGSDRLSNWNHGQLINDNNRLIKNTL